MLHIIAVPSDLNQETLYTLSRIVVSLKLVFPLCLHFLFPLDELVELGFYRYYLLDVLFQLSNQMALLAMLLHIFVQKFIIFFLSFFYFLALYLKKLPNIADFFERVVRSNVGRCCYLFILEVLCVQNHYLVLCGNRQQILLCFVPLFLFYFELLLDLLLFYAHGFD